MTIKNKVILPSSLMLLICASSFAFGEAKIQINDNSQIVVIKGGVSNKATEGSQADMNIGSIVGDKGVSLGSNKQSIHIEGSVVNEASFSSKSTLNIGSIDTSEK